MKGVAKQKSVPVIFSETSARPEHGRGERSRRGVSVVFLPGVAPPRHRDHRDRRKKRSSPWCPYTLLIGGGTPPSNKGSGKAKGRGASISRQYQSAIMKRQASPEAGCFGPASMHPHGELSNSHFWRKESHNENLSSRSNYSPTWLLYVSTVSGARGNPSVSM
jgi:hypothetical protein